MKAKTDLQIVHPRRLDASVILQTTPHNAGMSADARGNISDRIIHHSHIFMLGGESYRLKQKTLS
jgi:DNA replication protein DnaC